MTDADHERRRARIRRETRWLAALLEGFAAAGFVAVFLRGQFLGPGLGTQVACAFAAAALVTFAVWPLADGKDHIHLGRASMCGFLAVVLGGPLWALLGALVHNLQTGGRSGFDAMDVVMMPVLLLLFFGWGTVPLGVGTALIAAISGNARLRALDRIPLPS